jgi:hypothetical protein
MKYCIFFAICALTFLACSKPDPPPAPVLPVIELGRLAYKKNGVEVNVEAMYKVWGNMDFFTVFHKSQEPPFQGHFLLGRLSPKTGTFEIDNTQGASTPYFGISWFFNENQYVGSVSPDTLQRNSNQVNIIRFNTPQNVVEGTFQAVLKKHSIYSLSDVGLQDSIKITEGRFHLKLE